MTDSLFYSVERHTQQVFTGINGVQVHELSMFSTAQNHELELLY
jgi:hypothetical protein